jgi:hypothetical protein
LDITVHNPKHVSHGISKLEVDGNVIKGNLVIIDDLQGTLKINAWMGS